MIGELILFLILLAIAIFLSIVSAKITSVLNTIERGIQKTVGQASAGASQIKKIF